MKKTNCNRSPAESLYRYQFGYGGSLLAHGQTNRGRRTARKKRADYGTQLLKELSAELTKEFGKGFSTGSLYYYRQFYNTFPEIFATPQRILSWSHYKRLIQVSNPEARLWYLKEAQEQMWSYRTLDRNIGSQYYERLLLSHNKEKVVTEMKSLTLPYQQDKLEFIKRSNPIPANPSSPNTISSISKRSGVKR